MNRFIDIFPAEIIREAESFKREGYRLAQVCALKREEETVLIYSFALGGELVNCRVALDGKAIASISGVYPYAFVYENEMHDLYGVSFEGLNIDFGGQFYRLKTPAPMDITAATNSSN